MSGSHIRAARPDDADRVRELVRAAYARWVPVIGREPRPMTADYSRAIAEHIVDVYADADVIVAVIEMVAEPSCLLVENVAVLPSEQGRGLGALLLAHAESVARSRGLGSLRLYTNAAFATNVALYKRRGYVERSRETLAAGGELVHMTKPLS